MEIETKAIDPNVGGGVDREKLDDADFVFSDERKFPVVTPADVKDAVSSWGRYKGSHTFDEFKRRLMSLCKRKGGDFMKELPDSWDTKAQMEALVALGISMLYDANKSDLAWVGVSHNAWVDRLKDILPLALIEEDIAIQKSLMKKGVLDQFGYGLWVDHAPNVIGDCRIREVIGDGRSCIEMGNLKGGSTGLDGHQMSIGYYYGRKGEEYEWITVYERSVLKNTSPVNARTFFSVKRRKTLSDAAMKSIVDELLINLTGGEE